MSVAYLAERFIAICVEVCSAVTTFSFASLLTEVGRSCYVGRSLKYQWGGMFLV